VRLIYNSRYGPVALPSEYKIHEGSIVFRTYRVTFTEEDLRTGIAHAGWIPSASRASASDRHDADSVDFLLTGLS
jgi:hypothetical protein